MISIPERNWCAHTRSTWFIPQINRAAASLNSKKHLKNKVDISFANHLFLSVPLANNRAFGHVSLQIRKCSFFTCIEWFPMMALLHLGRRVARVCACVLGPCACIGMLHTFPTAKTSKTINIKRTKHQHTRRRKGFGCLAACTSHLNVIGSVWFILTAWKCKYVLRRRPHQRTFVFIKTYAHIYCMHVATNARQMRLKSALLIV